MGRCEHNNEFTTTFSLIFGGRYKNICIMYALSNSHMNMQNSVDGYTRTYAYACKYIDIYVQSSHISVYMHNSCRFLNYKDDVEDDLVQSVRPQTPAISWYQYFLYRICAIF